MNYHPDLGYLIVADDEPYEPAQHPDNEGMYHHTYARMLADGYHRKDIAVYIKWLASNKHFESPPIPCRCAHLDRLCYPCHLDRLRAWADQFFDSTDDGQLVFSCGPGNSTRRYIKATWRPVTCALTDSQWDNLAGMANKYGLSPNQLAKGWLLHAYASNGLDKLLH